MKSKYAATLPRFLSRFACLVGLALPVASQAAGILTPINSSAQPAQLESHHVRVVINNGFARTEVEQVFINPNSFALEAIYTAPVPEDGALSELTIWTGEKVLNGEVVSKAEAETIYQEEKNQGNDVAKASQNSYQNFEFMVSAVPANGSARMRYVYYEPLPIDTGVGRYTYRLEEGGTDEAVASFWTRSDVVTTDFSVEVLLKSAWPVAKTRTPSFGGSVETIDEKTLRYRYHAQGGSLNQDFVFYYMLADDLPGRLEMMTYRESEDKPGTFMMVMTPGVDLKPLESGSDFVFVLDVSGSMQGKLHTLKEGVKKAIGQLDPADRFRIVAFSDTAWDLTRDWVAATSENVAAVGDELDRLGISGGTNVYAAVERGLKRLDRDRVSSIVLVTDGVANQGVVDPAAFYKLLHGQDVRFFGFLLGNSSNWPLMQLMCDASGGAYRAVSNNDDIIGEILIAKNKIAYESLHHAELSISGVRTFDVTDFKLGKIHYGDQLILFGRYASGGPATVRLKARFSGQEQVYETDIQFPDTSDAHPELERLWALDQVSKIELNEMAGFVASSEAKAAVRDIGVAYQIVTDETSMIALDDASFERRGLDRRNQRRIQNESAASASNPNSRGAQRVDASNPMYQGKSHSTGGGGAFEPWIAVLVLGGATILWIRRNGGSRSQAIALIATASALGLFAPGEGRAADDDLEENRFFESGSAPIDRSIEAFWEVSEEEARVERRRPDGEPDSPNDANSRIQHRNQVSDTMTLQQARRRNASNGSFGVNLFKKIPLVEFVWGQRDRKETDGFSGSARR